MVQCIKKEILFVLLAFPTPVMQGPQGVTSKTVEGFHFQLRTIDGDDISESNFKSKVLLVDIWGTWCPPCRKAVPFLSRLYDSYKDRGFEILGLNFERTSGDKALQKVRAFADRFGIPYQLALGDQSILKQIKRFRGFPTLLFFKRGMVFDHLEVGFSDSSKKKIENWVAKAVEEVSSPTIEKKKRKPFRETFVFAGGKKIIVGDGKRYSLIFLEHPKACYSKSFKEKIKSLVGKPGVFCNAIWTGRIDQGAPKGDELLDRKALKTLRMGAAFPSMVLMAPYGKVLLRAAGQGSEVENNIFGALRKILKHGKTFRKREVTLEQGGKVKQKRK